MKSFKAFITEDDTPVKKTKCNMCHGTGNVHIDIPKSCNKVFDLPCWVCNKTSKKNVTPASPSASPAINLKDKKDSDDIFGNPGNVDAESRLRIAQQKYERAKKLYGPKKSD
jgi:hypothetical protein